MKLPVPQQKNDGSLPADNIVICKNPVKVIQAALKNKASEKTKNFLWDCLVRRFFLSGIDEENVFGYELSTPIKAVKLLLDAGVDINRETEGDRFPAIALHQAVKYCDDISIIKYLIKNGADANKTDGMGCSPLICCAYEYKSRAQKISEILIKAGADIHKKVKLAGNGKNLFSFNDMQKNTSFAKCDRTFRFIDLVSFFEKTVKAEDD